MNVPEGRTEACWPVQGEPAPRPQSLRAELLLVSFLVLVNHPTHAALSDSSVHPQGPTHPLGQFWVGLLVTEGYMWGAWLSCILE